jgi:RNA polymerase sigma-70 factor (ECF subfamily)
LTPRGAVRPRNEDADDALLDRARRGDREAFSVLVERHASRVLSAAWRIVGNRAEAEDVAQETFLAAYRALPTFRGESLFSTWLYRIAVNKCRDRLRSRPAEGEHATAAGEDDPPAEVAGAAAHHRTPEDLLLGQQRAGRIEEAIARLPALYREAFVLRHVEGLSYEEMSEALGADGGTLRMRVYKARTQLSQELAGLQ